MTKKMKKVNSNQFRKGEHWRATLSCEFQQSAALQYATEYNIVYVRVLDYIAAFSLWSVGGPFRINWTATFLEYATLDM